MKLRISKTLKFWVDVACEQRKAQHVGNAEKSVVAEVLSDFEQAGDAMRYLRADGKIGWKTTRRMLDRLADGERDAIEERKSERVELRGSQCEIAIGGILKDGPIFTRAPPRTTLRDECNSLHQIRARTRS
jgi:hypothetical protein